MNDKTLLLHLKKQVFIPNNYELSQFRQAMHDEISVVWVRFKPIEKLDCLKGEHLSITYDPISDQILGYMHLKESFCCQESDLPDENDAKQEAYAFLNYIDPKLLEKLDFRWIKNLKIKPISPPHDEGFQLKSGNIVIGVRVKFFNPSTEKYTWVIVGKNKNIIAFEREIIWNSKLARRVTNQWLHDSWIISKEINCNLIGDKVK